MNLSKRAYIELSRLLACSPDGHDDGFAVYCANESLQESTDAQQPIWETREHTGWKLKQVPVAHLPAQALHEVKGVRFFFGNEQTDHPLDFQAPVFLLDGEPVEQE